ncbi:PKD-like domain-containing protein, partial [Flavobacterium suncheonense]
QTVVIGASGSTTISTGALTADATYTLIDITSSGTPSCTQTVNGSVVVTVVPEPGVSALVTSPSYCSGQAIGVQLSDPNPANTTTTFTWTVAAVTGGVTGASAGSGSIISQVLTAGTVQGTVTYTVTPHIGSCTGPSQNVTVTVNPTPVLTVNPSGLTQNVCSGNTTNITLSSNIPGTEYYWTVNQSGATGASAGNADTTGIISQALTATSNQIGTVVYVITPYYNGCPGASKTVTVTVNPEPVATFNATSQDLCSGETTDIELSSSVAGTTFSWTVLQSNVLGAAPGTGSSIEQTLSTIGFTAGTVTYTITPSVNGCLGTPITVTVNVNPRPDVIGDTQPPICSGGTTSIILNSAFAGVEYHWTVTSNGVSGASDGSNTTGEIFQTLTTTSDNNGT